ncbi:hypothetical protein C8241_15075 [Paracidovorax avenae]|nr:hypothetical protein C8241_15075 [Paracidovorax avenae]
MGSCWGIDFFGFCFGGGGRVSPRRASYFSLLRQRKVAKRKATLLDATPFARRANGATWGDSGLRVARPPSRRCARQKPKRSAPKYRARCNALAHQGPSEAMARMRPPALVAAPRSAGRGAGRRAAGHACFVI